MTQVFAYSITVKMLTAQQNSLPYINAADFPKAEYTMNNVQGQRGRLRYCRKLAESVSAEADLCTWLVYQFTLDPFWIHKAIITATQRESRLSQQSGIMTLGVILQLHVTVAAPSSLAIAPKTLHIQM